MSDAKIKERLEYLRGEIRAERISIAELFELESLSDHIEKGDVELLEPAGVPEFKETEYDLKKDHEGIKAQIKEWETKIDDIFRQLNTVFEESTLGDIPKIQEQLDDISHEMMSINL